MNEKSDQLKNLLSEWQPEPLSAEGVRREVWKRIERLEPSPWKKWTDFFDVLVGRPFVATGILAVAMTVGVLIGTMASAPAQTESYLQSISAFHQAR